MCKRSENIQKPATSEPIRQLAHAALDRIIDSVDGISGVWATVGIDVTVQNGKIAVVQERTSRTHKAG